MALLILSGSMGVGLITDLPTLSPHEVFANRLRFDEDVLGAIVDEITSLGFARSRIGLVGGDTLTADHLRWLETALPSVMFDPSAESIVQELRVLKSPTERDLLRRAAATGIRALRAIGDAVDVGVTEAELASIGAKTVIADGLAVANIFVSTHGAERSQHWRLPLRTLVGRR